MNAHHRTRRSPSKLSIGQEIENDSVIFDHNPVMVLADEPGPTLFCPAKLVIKNNTFS